MLNTRRLTRYAVAYLIVAILVPLQVVPASAITGPAPQEQSSSIRIWSNFGGETAVLGRTARPAVTTVPAGVTAKVMRSSARMFRLAGGVMFDAVATAAPQLQNRPLRLVYDPTQADGRRVAAIVSTQRFVVPGLYDADLRPIAEFAASTNPVVVNLLDTLPGEKEDCRRPRGLHVVSVHPALTNTRLAWPLARADMLPWSLKMGRQWHTYSPIPAAAVQLGDDVTARYDQDTQDYMRTFAAAGLEMIQGMSAEETKQLEATMREYTAEEIEGLEADFLKSTGLDAERWRQFPVAERRQVVHIAMVMISRLSNQTSNINDVMSAPSLVVSGTELRISGHPRVEFFGQLGDETVVFERSSDFLSSKAASLHDVDAEAYNALVLVYRAGGLFRYARATSPSSWQQFVQSLPRQPFVESPVIACPTCEPGVVEEWLQTCVSTQ
jgi:hypothetical protein